MCNFVLLGYNSCCLYHDLYRWRTRTKFGERAFSYVGPAAWNLLPDDLRQTPTINSFKRKLKTYLFISAFSWFYFSFFLIIIIIRQLIRRRNMSIKSLRILTFVDTDVLIFVTGHYKLFMMMVMVMIDVQWLWDDAPGGSTLQWGMERGLLCLAWLATRPQSLPAG